MPLHIYPDVYAMNKRIDLAALPEGTGKSRPEQVALFALINLGIVESLSKGLTSAAESLQLFFMPTTVCSSGRSCVSELPIKS